MQRAPPAAANHSSSTFSGCQSLLGGSPRERPWALPSPRQLKQIRKLHTQMLERMALWSDPASLLFPDILNKRMLGLIRDAACNVGLGSCFLGRQRVEARAACRENRKALGRPGCRCRSFGRLTCGGGGGHPIPHPTPPDLYSRGFSLTASVKRSTASQ